MARMGIKSLTERKGENMTTEEKRTALLKQYGLPEHLGTQAAAQALSRLITREDFLKMFQASENSP